MYGIVGAPPMNVGGPQMKVMAAKIASDLEMTASAAICCTGNYALTTL